MRIYEMMLVLDPEMSKEHIDVFLTKIKQLLSDRGAEVLKVEEWGVNTLAYEIKKKKKGYYILLYLRGNSALVAEIEKNLRLMEEVLRYLTVKRDKNAMEASEQGIGSGQEKEPLREKKFSEEIADDGGSEAAAEET